MDPFGIPSCTRIWSVGKDAGERSVVGAFALPIVVVVFAVRKVVVDLAVFLSVFLNQRAVWFEMWGAGEMMIRTGRQQGAKIRSEV